MNDQPIHEEALVQKLLTASGRGAPAPDVAFLGRLREASADAFVAASGPAVGRRALRRSWRLVIPAAAAVLAVGLFLGLWFDFASPVQTSWAQVVRSFESVKTLHFAVKVYDHDKLVDSGQAYYEGTEKARMEETRGTSVIVGNQVMHCEPRSHLYIVEDVRPEELGASRMIYAIFTMPTMLAQGQGPPGQIRVGDGPPAPMELKALGSDKIDGQALKHYEVVRLIAGEQKPYTDEMSLQVWCDEKGQVRSARADMPKEHRRIEMDIELNPQLPADTFELKGPPGYTDVRQGIFPRLSPELKTIADAYYAAREKMQHYEMVVVPNPTGNYGRYRQVRDGDRWRLDSPDLDFMITHSDRFKFDKLKDKDFKSVWEAYGDPTLPVEQVVMTYHGQMAMAGFNYSSKNGESAIRSQWIVPPVPLEISSRTNQMLDDRQKVRWFNQPPRMGVGSLADDDLRQLGWPQWMGDELVAPHGWDMGTLPPVYYRMPDRDGLAVVRAIQGPNLHEYVIDPARDYLCVSYDEYSDRNEPWKAAPGTWDPDEYYHKPRPIKPEFDAVHTSHKVVEFAKTAQGRWYPKKFGDGTRVFLDTQGVIDPRFFDWPKGAPEPPAVNVASKDIGTAFLEGSPEAREWSARQKCQENMQTVVSACARYGRDHKGLWPDDPAALVKLNYLAAEDLLNPRRPGLSPGFVYRKPDPDQWLMYQIVLYEPAEPWPKAVGEKLPSGVFVGRASGDVQWVQNQADFEAMLAKKYPR